MPTRIEYATDTLELTSGCTPMSEGCEHCWAKVLAKGRLKRFYPDGFNKIVLHLELLNLPFGWRKPRRIFVSSRSDLFHKDVPDWFLRQVFGMIWRTPQHSYLILTKRVERMMAFALDPENRPWPENAWVGASVENQKRADERLSWLALIPTKVRFVSLEPLLGPVNIQSWVEPYWTWEHGRYERGGGINWIVVGGESGPNHRPMEIAWLEQVVADCRDAGVPVWVKQASSSRPGQQGDIPDDLWQIKEWPKPLTRPVV